MQRVRPTGRRAIASSYKHYIAAGRRASFLVEHYVIAAGAIRRRTAFIPVRLQKKRYLSYC